MENYSNLSLEARRTFWQEHVERWQRSGLSQQQYCTREQIKARTFSTWKHKLGKTFHTGDLVEIPSHVISDLGVFENYIDLIVNKVVSIRIRHNFDPQLLKKVLQVLGISLC